MKKKEFELLRCLGENHVLLTQRMISEITGLSLGTVNSLLSKYQAEGVIDEDYRLTRAGYTLLEPFKVDNAIIISAEKNNNFVPISYELSSNLITVKGEVLIERVIRQLKERGIGECVVVIGHMMEQYLYLREKYNVKIIVDNEYNSKKDHSSLYAARDYLKNSYIIPANVYYLKNCFHTYEYGPYCCGKQKEGVSYTAVGLTIGRGDLIKEAKQPAKDQWVKIGHTYFDAELSEIFRGLLEEYYGKRGTENLTWEDIYIENVGKLPLTLDKKNDNIIRSFSGLNDIKYFDPGYIYNNKIVIFDNICRILCCELTDIEDVELYQEGINNYSFRFLCNGQYYIYWHPRSQTADHSGRKREAACLRAAKKLRIDETLIYVDEEYGWKIFKWVEDTEHFDFKNKDHIRLLAKKLKTLHSADISVGVGFDYMKEADGLIEQLKHIDWGAYQRCLAEREKMLEVFSFLENEKWQVSLCHNDLYQPNLILCGDELYITNWEFAGDTDIGYDICKLFAVQNPPWDQLDFWLEDYFERKVTEEEKRHLIACASVIYYYWYVWGIYAGKTSLDVSFYMLDWYDKMNSFRVKALEMIIRNH